MRCFVFAVLLTASTTLPLAAQQGRQPQARLPLPVPIGGLIQPGYFLFPIKPGLPNSLSGGLGDLRGNHFHAGLDIRTDGREGLPVRAAADGYVSRIAVFTGGYGNVLFIKHPNGLTTVYGHLLRLNDTLQAHLRQNQYARQTFEIDLRPGPGEFSVKQGDVIALSGNTGGSGGPHLHFEVRDAIDNLINPLLYGFKELTDDVPPYFERIALKALTTDSRVNGEYGRISVAAVRRADGTYGITQPITARGLLGLELLAYDKANGSPYRNGLNCIEVKLDGREVFTYSMNAFPNPQTRAINVHMNYEAEQLTGQRYHRAYVSDGNPLPLYQTRDALRGRLPLLDGKPHTVEVTLFDAYEHTARLVFTIQPDPNVAQISNDSVPPLDSLRPTVSLAPDDNVLKLAVSGWPTGRAPAARLFERGKTTELPVAYRDGAEAIYLVNLTKHLPDSIRIGRGVLRTNLKKRIAPGRAETFRDGPLTLRFQNATLFDTLYLATQVGPGQGWQINQSVIPINEALEMTYQLAQPVADTLRTRAYHVSGRYPKFLGGTWDASGRSITAKSRELGRFALLTDGVAPSIRLVVAAPGRLAAVISDDLSGIDKFRAMVNGEWTLLQYDYKRALVWADTGPDGQPFAEGANVVLQVRDRAGNVANLETTIERPKPPARKATKKRRRR